ncbi:MULTISPECIES: NmrA family NAD(P)-binding protein [unclassified Corallococcus]|uniref:NmrA family NAD(P)-binding protein n=1 Tax=unclassified Corallococcus TaxID=2685029 RepID=UPI001A8EE27C|nr:MULTISPECIES: NmrA family NAD(P)-binding protein [unclassified Corallococcus]MBN9682755.1 NmrA family NAD(P)-binding protein [Corallococcus sp. NCSPR001]WAS85704.1 NmrA family NAD(P)-binding protein [Corallococcus sp. NCRR]
MTRILVIGAAGNTGRPIAQGLTAEGFTVRTATRDTRPPVAAAEHVRFDWADPSTHGAALEGVDRMYILAPALVEDPSSLMTSVLERALSRGVRRVVLLSASVVPEGGPGLGQVHHFLRTRAPEWSVLQPSWFMQNFVLPGHHHADSLQRDGTLVTATGQGRVGFVAAEDIAAVGVRALADARAHDTAHVITGPQALSYDDLAAILSRVTGRPIRHVHATPEEAQRHLQASGMPEVYARFLTMLDTLIRDGAEDRVTDTVLRVTGRAPRDFESFVRARR